MDNNNFNYSKNENISLKEKAYKTIKNLILSAKLKPGDPLSTSRLCELLSMSRTPIRDAIKKLESEGLVSDVAGRGHFVKKLTSKDIKEIYYLRKTLEVAALKLSINNIRDEQIMKLERRFDEAEKNLDEYIKNNKLYLFNLDKDLHKLITHESMNNKLIKFLDIINSQVELIRSISAVMPGRLEKSYNEHRKLLSAIKKRDLEEAKKCLELHLDNIEENSIHINENFKKFVREVELNERY